MATINLSTLLRKGVKVSVSVLEKNCVHISHNLEKILIRGQNGVNDISTVNFYNLSRSFWRVINSQNNELRGI